MTIAERAKEARMKAGLSQVEASEKVGCKQTVISKIEAGEIKKSSYFEKLAKIYNIDFRWLITGEGFVKEEDVYSNDEKNQLPILMGNEIIRWCLSELSQKEIIIPSREFVFSPFHKDERKRKFAIKIKDESMSTKRGVSFYEGSKVIIDPDRQWIDGDFILTIESTGIPTLYQYEISGAYQLLKPLNSRYPIHRLDNTYAIVGTAVAHVNLFNKV